MPGKIPTTVQNNQFQLCWLLLLVSQKNLKSLLMEKVIAFRNKFYFFEEKKSNTKLQISFSNNNAKITTNFYRKILTNWHGSEYNWCHFNNLLWLATHQSVRLIW